MTFSTLPAVNARLPSGQGEAGSPRRFGGALQEPGCRLLQDAARPAHRSQSVPQRPRPGPDLLLPVTHSLFCSLSGSGSRAGNGSGNARRIGILDIYGGEEVGSAGSLLGA